MAERRQVLDLARRGLAAVMATLVHVKGSSYRRTGARLLLGTDGSYAGSISGGCLEGDLLLRAKWLIRNGPRVQHYSTAFDDTAEVPFGLGCGGELDLLLERADSEEFKALLEALERSLAGVEQRVVTRLPAEGGAELARVIFEGGVARFASEGLAADEMERMGALEEGQGWPVYAVEVVRAPQRLVVFGAGDDARPMVRMAEALGWSIWVADGRRQMARAERFPGAGRVVVLGATERVEVRAEDAVVLMTHSYQQDRELLAEVLPAGPRYLGLLGARHRSSLLLTEVAADLGWPLEVCCERVHAPVGLDLGGDGAEAIALAVMAEIQATIAGRSGAQRRLGAAEARLLAEQGGALQYAEMQCSVAAAG